MNKAAQMLGFTLALSSVFVAHVATAGQLSGVQQRPSQIVISSVSAVGTMDDWALRSALKPHRDATFPRCTIPETTNKYSLTGRVYVRGVLQADLTLRIDRIDATKEHAPLTSCVKSALATWKIGRSSADKGTEVSFRFYISFPKSADSSYLRAKPTKITQSIGSFGKGLAGTGTGGGTSGSRLARLTSSSYGYGSASSKYGRAKATVSVLKVSGALSRSVVEWALQQTRLDSDLSYCQSSWKRRKSGKAAVRGSATLNLRVSPVGALEKIELAKIGFADADLQKCIVEKSARLTLPKAKSATNISLVITFK